MAFKSIALAHKLANKFVLVRLDTNIPLQGKRVLDDSKLRMAVPTIRLLERKGARLILLGHLGRPGGKTSAKLSLKPIGYALGKILRQPVKVLPLHAGVETVRRQAEQGLVLLENVRFDKGEDNNDQTFARQIARLGQFYVNEAFACSHRASATIVSLAKKLPSFAGLNLLHEVAALEMVRLNGAKPVVAVIGGAKISDKLPAITKLLPRLSAVLVGGGVANTLLKARGFNVGKSLVDASELKLARQLIKKAGKKLLMPLDVVVDNKRTKKTEAWLRPVEQIKSSEKVVDLGTATCRLYAKHLKKAKTIFWAGPLGMIEEAKWRHATLALGRLVSALAGRKAYVVVGGGETAGFFNQHNLTVDFISTGGSAMLDFLANEPMPGLIALGYRAIKQ
jgi:phosphoglycerate kinase